MLDLGLVAYSHSPRAGRTMACAVCRWLSVHPKDQGLLVARRLVAHNLAQQGITVVVRMTPTHPALDKLFGFLCSYWKGHSLASDVLKRRKEPN